MEIYQKGDYMRVNIHRDDGYIMIRNGIDQLFKQNISVLNLEGVLPYMLVHALDELHCEYTFDKYTSTMRIFNNDILYIAHFDLNFGACIIQKSKESDE
jgi:hypothetical protein